MLDPPGDESAGWWIRLVVSPPGGESDIRRVASPPGDESAGVSAPVVSPPGDESAGNRFRHGWEDHVNVFQSVSDPSQ